jgi:hypothetical protein
VKAFYCNAISPGNLDCPKLEFKMTDELDAFGYADAFGYDELTWALMSDTERQGIIYAEEDASISRHVKTCTARENDIYCKICEEM